MNEKEILPLLDQMVEDIRVPGIWISGRLAEDENGVSVAVRDGCRFCLVGLARKICYDQLQNHHNVPYWALIDALSEQIDPGSKYDCETRLMVWNDETQRTLEDVIGIVERTRDAVAGNS